MRFLSPLQSSQGTFFPSDLHTAAPRISTRPWPNWFLFSFNIPLELAGTKLTKRKRKKSSPYSAGKHKSLQRGPEKKLLFGGYRKVKIINVDSIEALHTDKEGKTLHSGSTDPHSVINSFKEAEIKREQHVSRGRKGLSASQTGLAPARSPQCLSKNHSHTPTLHCPCAL